MSARRAAALVVLALAASPRAAPAQEGAGVVNVTPSFPPGPYVGLAIDPANPTRLLLSNEDGVVAFSEDAGTTVRETRVVPKREFAIMALRSQTWRHREYVRPQPQRGGNRLFRELLMKGLPVARIALWMSLEDPLPHLPALAIPAGPGALAAAGPAGVFVSDEHRGSWLRAVGLPRPKGNDIVGISIAIDPADPRHILAGTNKGFLCSWNRGETFAPVRSAGLDENEVTHITFDPGDPKHVLVTTHDEIFNSADGGRTFEKAMAAPGEIRAFALAEDGAYIGTDEGLLIVGQGDAQDVRFRKEPIVGVVPLGGGAAIVATDMGLFFSDKEGKEPLVHTTDRDPFVTLAGTPELVWAVTKTSVLRVGPRERRARAEHPPTLMMTMADVERALVKRYKFGDSPDDLNIHDRWWAKLLPSISVRLKGVVTRTNTVGYDGALPIPFRYTSASDDVSCCGGVPGQYNPAVLVFARWELTKIFMGDLGNPMVPHGFIQRKLREAKETVIAQARTRYRLAAELVKMLERPPTDPQVALTWRLRLEEHVSYLEMMTGRKVAVLPETHDLANDLEEAP